MICTLKYIPFKLSYINDNIGLFRSKIVKYLGVIFTSPSVMFGFIMRNCRLITDLFAIKSLYCAFGGILLFGVLPQLQLSTVDIRRCTNNIFKFLCLRCEWVNPSKS